MTTVNDKFRSVPIFSIAPGVPITFRIAIFFKGRHLVFRNPGQVLESEVYNRFIFKRILKVLVPEEDFNAYSEYVRLNRQKKQDEENKSDTTPEKKLVNRVIDESSSAVEMFFGASTPQELEESAQKAIEISKKTVQTILTKSYMQVYDNLSYNADSVIAHSSRTAMIAVFLGYQLGFVNPVGLEHLATAALLHDAGKVKTGSEAAEWEDTPEIDKQIEHDHPNISCDLLKNMLFVPEEVLRIIREHHEYRDGTGFPAKLRGPKMYGLSRVFAIANAFDNLVSEQKGTHEQRGISASKIMLGEYRNRYDAELLPKAMRILTKNLKG